METVLIGPSEVKRYLRERHRAPLGDIAVHFGTSQDNARSMVEPWLAKGKVRRIDGGGCCSGGCSCHCDKVAEVYEWIEPVG